MKKTNAMRILEAKSLDYESLTYEVDDDKIDGISVAKKIRREEKMVYKTLIAQGARDYYVFIIPVAEELDLKKAAKLAQEKKIDMIHAKDIRKVTGYIRGGCSPIGMKKDYRTFIDQSVRQLDSLVVSGGKIGSQIELKLSSLEKAVDLEVGELTK